MESPKTNIVRDRQSTHGDPVENMNRIAQAWSGILGHEVSAVDVARCMSALHLVRDAAATVEDASHLEHADGYTDIARIVKASTQAPLIVEGNTDGWLRCGAPVVQAGTDGFCTLPVNHDGPHVDGGGR